MARPRPPIWLAAPSRFARLDRRQARLALLLLGAFLALCLTALFVPGPPPVSHDPAKRADDQADVLLYEKIVAGVRGGGDYYRVTAAALRAGDYPLKPFVTFRLPTLAIVQAMLPRAILLLMLYALVAGVMIAWGLRLRPALQRAPPLLIALILLAGGLAAFVQPSLASFHEIWGGLLIALALALRRPGRWIEAAAIGMIAMLIRETAALFVLVMAAAALIEGYRREAAGWAASLVVLAGVITLHALAVARVVTAVDPASPGWSGLLGFGFFVKTMTISSALSIVPAWLAALLVGLAMFGWASWAAPLARRALMTLAAYAMLISVAGRTDTFYWGLLVVPLLPIGLVFVPDALRDLIVAALDRRRIIVTKALR